MRSKIKKCLVICLLSTIWIAGCQPTDSDTNQETNSGKKSGIISDDNPTDNKQENKKKEDENTDDVIIDHEMKDDNKAGGIYEFVPED